MTTPNKVGRSRPSLAQTPTVPGTPSIQLTHQQSLQETFTVLGELTHEFKNHADETALINKFLAKKREIAALVASKQSVMKDLIQALTQQVTDLNQLTSQPPKLGIQQKQELLQQQTSVVTQQIQQLLAEIERLESKGVEMEKQKQMLQQQKRESEQTKLQQMPSLASTMGLYRNFSSIAWDYDAPKSTVKGTFYFDRSIKNFKFERSEMTDFEIANSLWEMMEGSA